MIPSQPSPLRSPPGPAGPIVDKPAAAAHAAPPLAPQPAPHRRFATWGPRAIAVMRGRATRLDHPAPRQELMLPPKAGYVRLPRPPAHQAVRSPSRSPRPAICSPGSRLCRPAADKRRWCHATPCAVVTADGLLLSFAQTGAPAEVSGALSPAPSTDLAGDLNLEQRAAFATTLAGAAGPSRRRAPSFRRQQPGADVR